MYIASERKAMTFGKAGNVILYLVDQSALRIFLRKFSEAIDEETHQHFRLIASTKKQLLPCHRQIINKFIGDRGF